MGLFSRKKKRSTTLTDEDRDNAQIRRRQLKQLRDMDFQRELLTKNIELLEVKQDLQEIKGSDDDNLFGLGTQEMQLLNIVTKGKINNIMQPLQEQSPLKPQPTAEGEPVDEDTNSKANLLIENLPPALLKQLRNIDPKIVHAAIDKL